MDSIVTLTATLPNKDMLLNRALPSIKAQSHSPIASIIVFDTELPTKNLVERISQTLYPIKTHIINNHFERGASGSWNTGLQMIYDHYPNSYVAILDDDDQWDHNHLSECTRTATIHNSPDAVLSGLRMNLRNQIKPRELLTDVTIDDFLVGNPGWQGSNTFVSAKAIKTVGGFTAGMRSSNDRDLAIRLLSIPKFRIAYTRKFTATWFCGERDNALSHPGSTNKLFGLAQFYDTYGRMMNRGQKHSFFQRSKKLFNFSQKDIQKALERNK